MPRLKDRFNYDTEPYSLIREAARGVTGAYGAANKWLDTVQEWLLIERGMAHTSDLIHGIAHRALERLDDFSAILHTRHLATEYPATAELTEDFSDVSDALEAVCAILEQTGEALKRFRDAANGAGLDGMALAAENLMVQNDAEFTAVLKLWQMWDQGISAASFDNWALHIKEGGVG
jgi:hypothetical protein